MSKPRINQFKVEKRPRLAKNKEIGKPNSSAAEESIKTGERRRLYILVYRRNTHQKLAMWRLGASG